jgi:GNAT superfamily N-acetyltransferase
MFDLAPSLASVPVSTIEVRRIDATELPAIVTGIPSRTPERYRRQLELQDRGGFVFLIGWLDGAPVGFVGVGMHEDGSPEVLAESRGFAMVSDLYVEEPYRRRGVGRALMLALEREARAAGMPGVILDTGTGEPFEAARALYRDLGYVDQGGIYLGGWSDPDRPGVHLLDALTLWVKPF